MLLPVRSDGTLESENDNNPARVVSTSSTPDAHGQAAMLLVESLIHGLIQQSIITVADAVRFVDAAADVREEVAYEHLEPPETLAQSLTILRSVSSSLRLDLGNPTLKPTD